MKKQLLIILLLLTVSEQGLKAQNSSLSYDMHQLPKNYALPSPEAASMTKVADIPVDLSTGHPNIEIPLYTIHSGKLTVPISLTYDASGIKVEQEATAVGLSWNISAGGTITRTIRDKDDFGAGPNYESLGGPSWDDAVPDPQLPSMSLYNIAYQVTSTINGDAIPDMYMYNFPGNSGRFVRLGNTNGVKLLPKKNINVTGGYNGWNIVDQSGTSYAFTQYETNNLREYRSSIAMTNDQSVQNIRTAWHLSSMTTHDLNDVVNFEYDDTYIETGNGKTRTQVYDKTKFDFLTTSHLIDAASVNNSQKVHGKILKKISFNNGSVEFTISYNTANNLVREDLLFPNSVDPIANHQPRVDKMVVKDKDENVIRQVNFYYSYFIVNPSSTNPTDNKRLRLDSVIIHNNNNLPEVYKFVYNTDKPMPFKTSYGLDYWGYYNGQNTNNTLIPTYNFLKPANNNTILGTPTATDLDFVDCNPTTGGGSGGSTPGGGANIFLGANRSPVPLYTKTGILKKIIYPTGGSASFEFENHDIPRNPDTAYMYLHLDSSIYVSKISGTQQSISGTIDPLPSNGVATGLTEIIIPNTPLTANGVKVKLAADYSFPSSYDNYVLNHITSNVVLRSYNGGTAQIIKSQAFNGVNGPISVCWDNFTLMPGFYTLTVSTGDGTTNAGLTVSAGLSILLPIQIINSTPNTTLPGLRIKSVAYEDGMGHIRKKNYQYSIPGDPNGKSSGQTHFPVSASSFMKNGFTYYGDVNHAPLCWHQTTSGTLAWNLCCYETGPLLILSSNTNYDMGAGAEVNYKYVTEVDNNGENGKVISQLSATPTPNLPWEDGLLLHKMVYDAGNTLVQDDSMVYNFYGVTPEKYTGFRITDQGHHPCINAPDMSMPNNTPGGIDNNEMHYKWEPVNMISEWVTTTKKISTQYFNGNAISQTENYEYDPVSMEVSKVTKETSDGRKIVDHFRYPTAYVYTGGNTLSPEMQAVKGLNNVHAQDQVVEKYTAYADAANNESVTQAAYMAYQPQQAGAQTTGIPYQVYNIETVQPLSNFQPSQVNAGSTVSIDKDNSYKLQATIMNYDQRLNPTEVKDEHGDINAMLWMYNREYMVAKVTNAPLDKIAYSSFETDETGNWTYNVSGITGSEHVTGNRAYDLSQGDITANVGQGVPGYIIAYRSKNGAVTVNGNGPDMTGNTVNGWTYYEHHVQPGPVAVSGTGLIDEVRLYPGTAQMATCTYNPLIGVTSACDAAGHIVYYEYDNLGRLSVMRDEQGKILKKIDYAVQKPE